MTTAANQQDQDGRSLNSSWMLAMTASGGYYRRQLFIFLGGFFWGLLAYINYLPGAQVFATLNLLFYPLRIFTDPRVFVTLLVGLICFQLILVITLILLHKPMLRLRYWLPTIFAFLLVLFYLAWGPYLTFPQWSTDNAIALLLYPLRALVSPGVLRWVLVAALGFWAAYRTAAIYLEDIYELGDIQVAQRFILQAVFGSQYHFIAIREGEVQPELKKSPVYRIGGPGLVRVHLDTAALFEALDGTPRVVGPTVEKPGVVALSGFERLRSIIDLRDQMNKYSITGRTRDGIRIQLKDVNTLFSVDRGGQNPSRTRPYPFEKQAIKRLVYRQGLNSWVTATDSLIRRRFGEFISQHTLSEFLAAIGAPELEQASQAQAELRQAAEALAGTSSVTSVQSPVSPPDFFSRTDVMTELFADEFRRKEAAELGVEIKWIGGGTWELPDAIVPQRHLEAWKLSRENLLRSSPAAMQQISQESQVAELARLVEEVPVATYQSSKELPSRQALRQLLLAYHKVLHEAYEGYQRSPGDPAQKEWLRQVLVFLTRFTAHWLGGP
jgi:hypothetical protein